jgi:hypothetical protein
MPPVWIVRYNLRLFFNGKKWLNAVLYSEL